MITYLERPNRDDSEGLADDYESSQDVCMSFPQHSVVGKSFSVLLCSPIKFFTCIDRT